MGSPVRMEFEVQSPAATIDVPLDPRIDALVAALDGCRIEGETANWTAAVHGVHADEHGWWIQVSRADDASASVVLRCSRFATAAHVRAALRHWRPAKGPTLQILDGMGTYHGLRRPLATH